MKLLGLGAASAAASTVELSECNDIEIMLEETGLNTSLGTQYELKIQGADSVELYEKGEKIGEYSDTDHVIIPEGEYVFRIVKNGCSYNETRQLD